MRFVHDVVLLVPQIDGEETILTALEIKTKGTIRAILQVLGVAAIVGVVTLDRFVAKCGVIAKRTVHAIFAVLDEQIKVAILV